MAREHSGRVALVTGASRGIGQAIAWHLGREGAKVLCISRSLESGAQTVEKLAGEGLDARAYAVDVSSASQVKAAGEAILQEYGRVDILVNNAGINRDNLLIRMTDGEWDSVLRTDLDSCFTWTRVLCRPMMQNRWGRILNMASVIGLIGNGGQANYAAAKAGVIGFTKAVARELASRNVTVNALAPGFIETSMTAALPAKVSEQILEKIPMKCYGKPDDVAAAAAFLASEKARYITGQVLAVDGGMTMC
jgi:3-oxoacyl-[acyl-carrier protein] reductase